MRIANLAGRSALIAKGDSTLALDVQQASDRRFTPDPQAVWGDFEAFSDWANDINVAAHPDAVPFELAHLASPVPAPSQIFAIGLNYVDHAKESGLDVPEQPVVFTKFASSMTGASTTVTLTGERVDWEAEMVFVLSAGGRDIPVERGWAHVAALMVGQDISDRTVQQRGHPAQFSMGKSFAGYSPMGPWATTVDEVCINHDPDDLAISCTVAEGEVGPPRVLQDGRTSSMVFSVPELVARLSSIVELRPGDVVWTGTPAGVGMGRDPQQFLTPGQKLATRIEGLGEITQRLIASPIA